MHLKNESEAQIKGNVLTHISFVPQQIRTQQVQAVRQTTTTRSEHRYQANLTEQAVVKKQHGVEYRHSERLPQFFHKGDNMRMYQTPEMALRCLLGLARSKEDCRIITPKDIEYIVYCCNYTGLISLTPPYKLAKLAIRILSYLAQNQRQLPASALNVLTIKLQEHYDGGANPKTLDIMLLALAHAFLNGQRLLPVTTENLSIVAGQFIEKYKSQVDAFSTMAVMLAVCAMLNPKLLNSELDILKNILMVPVIEEQFIYIPQNINLGYAPPISRPWRLNWVRVFEVYFLKSIKHKSYDNKLLTEAELRYTTHQWEGANIRDRATASDIVTRALMNKQHTFPEQQAALICIQRALTDGERKIKNNAILAISCLFRHGEIKNRDDNNSFNRLISKIKVSFDEALKYQRKYALLALNQHIEKQRNIPISNLAEWIFILEQLQQNADVEVSNSARFTLFHIKNDLNSIEGLLLDCSCHVEVSKNFCDAVQQLKRELSENAIDKLGKLLAGRKYRTEAKINAAITLGYAVENGQILPRNIIKIIIRKAASRSNRLCSAAFTALGNVALTNISNLYVVNLIRYMAVALAEKEKANAASFLLANFLAKIEFSKRDHDKDAYFSDCFDKASIIVADNTSESETKKNCALALANAVQKKFALQVSTLENLAQSLRGAESENIKSLVLMTLGSALENAASIEWSDKITNKILGAILIPLFDKKERLRDDAAHVLGIYIKKTNLIIPNATVEKMIDLIKDTNTALMGCELIKNIVEKEWEFSDLAIEKIVGHLTHQYPEIRVEVSFILGKISMAQKISEKLISQIELAIDDIDENVVGNVLLALQRIFKKSSSTSLIRLTQKTCHQLVQMANGYNDKKIQIYAISILAAASERGLKFSMEEWDLLTRLAADFTHENNELRNFAVHALAYQVRHMVIAIKNNNMQIQQIILVLEKNLNVTAPMSQLLFALKQASDAGYQVSEEGLNTLAEILLVNTDKEVIEKAYDIIGKAKNLHDASDKAKRILELEQCGRILTNPIIFEPKCKKAIQRLLCIATEMHELTQNNLHTIESILQSSLRDFLHVDALKICHQVAKNGQQLHNTLLNLLKNLIKNDSISTDFQRYAALILAETARYHFISNETFIAIEDIFGGENQILDEYLIALEIAVKRNLVLQQRTIIKIIALLDHKKPEIRQIAAKIISKLPGSMLNLELLIEKLHACTDILVQKELITAIKNIVRQENKVLASQELNRLSNVLKRNKFSEIRKKMVSLFNIMESKQKLPDNIKFLIYVKQQENLFLQDDCNIEIQLQALSAMQKSVDFLTPATFKKLEKLLLNSTDIPTIDAVIKLITVAQEEIILPKAIYEVLVINIAKAIANENALFMLKQAIELKTEMSVATISGLKEILINHLNNALRKFAYHRLCEIKQYQEINSAIEEILNLEPPFSEILTKKFLRTHLKKLCIAIDKKHNEKVVLSLGNVLLLMQALHQGDAKLTALSVNIIENTYPFIEQNFYPIIFNHLTQYFFKAPNKQEHIFKICLDLVQRYDFSESVLRESFIALINTMKPEKVSIAALSLLHIISKQHTITISKQQFETLVNILLTNLDPQSQIKVTQVLTSLLMGNEENCVLYFENISRFLQIITKVNKASASSMDTDALTPRNWSGFYSLVQQINEIVVGSNSSYQVSYVPEVQKELCYLLSYLYGMQHKIKKVDASIVSMLSEYLSSSIGVSAEVMQQLIQCTDAQKINLMLTISASDFYEDFLILENQDPTTHMRTLLCHELFMRYETIKNDNDKENDAADEEYIEFYSLLSILEESQQWGHGYNEERDNFLRALLTKQKNECLSLYKINQLLSIADKSSQLVEQTFIHKTLEMKTSWIKQLFDSYQWQVTDNDITEIQEFIEVLAWDPEMVDEFLQTCSPSEDIVSLKNLLRLMSTYPMYAAEVVEDFIDIEPNKNNEPLIATLKKEFIQGLLTEIIVPIVEKFSYQGGSENSELDNKKQKLQFFLMKCVNTGWSFENLYQWLYAICDQIKNGTLKSDLLLEIMDMVCTYQLSEHEFYCYSKDGIYEELPNILHQLYIRKTFQFEGKERIAEKLINKVIKLNKNNPQVSQLVNQGQFITLLKTIDQCYKNIQTLPSTFSLSHATNTKKSICEWRCEDIKDWAQHIHSISKDKQNIQALYPEIFAVLKRACILHTGNYEPRIAQLLAMIVVLGADPNKGRMTEIITGEGKSLIIAMCAVIVALQGEKVDIVTSSPVLAERDAKYYQGFYELFNFKVANNTNDNQYSRGLKDCYCSDIDVVYGDAGNFQFDILRDEYSQLGTRGTRGFGTVIIDEVDNLLIDEGAKIAMLASPIPGMDSLHPILILIWQELCRLHQCLSYNEDDEQIHFIPKNAEGHEDNEIVAKDQISIFLQNKLEIFIHQVLYKQQDQIVQIPDQLKDFVKTQTPKWIQSALLAFYTYDKSVHYKLKKDHQEITSVIPVDFVNTGVAQNGTNWGDGLTQFLQIKHGLKLTSESLVTNFLSNVAFIKRYGHKVYGLTGTLGSESAQELLQIIYNIDCAHIPTHKLKQQAKFPGCLLETASEWKQEVVSSTIREAKQGRVSLVICESIESAEAIAKEISLQHKGSSKLYVDSDSNQNQFLDETLEGDTIVVATNLAGRGTDIKLDPKVIQKGGLHVCVTFLPNNLRIEHQALGRCARKGEPGTTQIILNESHVKTKLDHLYNADEFFTYTDKIEKIRKWRDENESARLAWVKQHELPQTENKDELFQKFCELLKKLDQVDKEENSLQRKFLNFVPDPSSSFLKFFSDNEIQYKRLAVEERWGLWLKKNNIENDGIQANELFDIFKAKVLQDYKSNNIIDNPCHYLAKGNYFLLRSNTLAEKLWSNALCKIAIADYDKAIALNSEQAYIAYYNKAYALIRIAEGNDYKEEAKKLLHKAQSILIDKLIPLQQSLSLNIQNIKKNNVIFEKELSQHLSQKCQLLELFQQSIAKAIKEIESSQKLLDIEYCNAMEALRYQQLNDQEAAKVLGQEPEIRGTYTVSFHDLKAHNNDMISDHQSINTIFKAGCKGNINIIFSSSNLDQQNDTNKSLAKLLPINRRPSENKEKNGDAKHQEQQQDQKERVGLIENLEYCTGAVKSGISHTANKVADVATQVTASISETWLNIKGWLCENQKAELVPVNLTLTNLDLDKMSCIILKHIEWIERPITLEFSGINNELLELLAQSSYAKEMYIVTNSQITQEGLYGCKKTYIPITELKLISHLEAIRNINSQLCFKELHKDDAEGIVQLLNKKVKDDAALKLKINIQLVINKISQKNADAILNDLTHEQATLTFADLDKANAVRVIYLTEKQHDNAIFQIKHLSKKQAEHLIKVADRKQQNFNVHTHLFETEFLKINPNKAELQEYKNSGHIYFYDIQEKNPLPWRAMILVGAIAALQIVGGVALAITTGGFAATVGLGLVADSFSEIMRLISTAQSREFNLSAYLCQKAISIAMILATAGLSVVQTKEVGKAVDVLTYAVGNYTDEVTRGAAEMLVTTARATNVSVARAVSNSVNVLQQLTTSLVKTGASQVLDGVSNFALEQAQNSIRECVNAELRQRFADGYWQKLLYRVFAIDKYLEGNEFQEDIHKNAKNLVSNMNFNVLGYSVLDIHALTKFEKDFSEILHKVDGKLPNFQEILKGKLFVSTEEAKKICARLKEHKILMEDDINLNMSSLFKHRFPDKRNALEYDQLLTDDSLNDLNFDHINLHEFNSFKKRIIEICRSYYITMKDEYFLEKNSLREKISSLFVEQINETLKTVSQVAKSIAKKLATDAVHNSLQASSSTNRNEKQADEKQAHRWRGGRRKRFDKDQWARRQKENTRLREVVGQTHSASNALKAQTVVNPESKVRVNDIKGQPTDVSKSSIYAEHEKLGKKFGRQMTNQQQGKNKFNPQNEPFSHSRDGFKDADANPSIGKDKNLIPRSAVDDRKQHFPNTDKAHACTRDNAPLQAGKNNNHQGRNNHQERWQKLTTNQLSNNGFKFAGAQNRNLSVTLSSHNHTEHLNVLLRNHHINSGMDERTKNFLINHSLTAIRETITMEIKEIDRRNTQKEIERMQEMIDSANQDFAEQNHTFLVEIKNIVNKIIALILIDKKITNALNSLAILNTNSQEAFTLNEIKNEAKLIHDICFYLLEHEERYEYLIKYLNKKFPGNHADIEGLLCEAKNIFVEYHEQLLRRNKVPARVLTSGFSSSSQTLSTAEIRPVNSYMHLVSTLTSSTASSISSIFIDREKNKQKIMLVEANAVIVLTSNINELSREVTILSQSQDELARAALNGFIKIFQKLNNVTPQRLEEIRQQKRKERGIDELIEELEKSENLAQKNPHDQQYVDKCNKLIEEIEQAEDEIEQEQKIYCQQYVVQVKQAQEIFIQHVKELNLSDNFTITQAIELQRRMISMVEGVLEGHKNNVSLDNSMNLSQAKNESKLSTQAKIQVPGNFGIFAPPKEATWRNNAVLPVVATATKIGTNSNSQSG